MKIEKTKLDSKSRIVIPKTFRRMLGIAENDNVFISLDEKNRAMIISKHKEKKVYQLIIEMGDQPGALLKLAQVLYENKFDLITTQSHSIMRSKTALWRILGIFKDPKKLPELKRKLRKAGAKSVVVTRV